MKYINRLIFIVAAGAGLLTACNKKAFQDINIDPQAQNTIDLNFLFTSAQLGAASGGSSGDNRYIDWRTNIGIASTAIQQMASISGIPNTGDKYQDNTEATSAPFDFIYSDQLKNIGAILKETGPGGFAEGKNANLVQATRILRAFLFHRLTDYYGSIPYTDALQASDKVFFPHYDKQKTVYLDLLKELDEATAALGSPNPSDGFGAADLYYKGDISKWKRWGYSLMLRLAMRLSNVDAATANTYVQKAVAGGVFQSNDDNVIVPMATAPNMWVNQNGISRAYMPGDGGEGSFLSKTFIDMLKGPNAGSVADDDPRLMIISGGIGVWVKEGLFEVSKGNPLDQKGMPNGKDINMLKIIEGNPNLNVDQTYSKLNTLMLDRDEPYMLMNYGEVELTLAEAAQRGIGGLTAAQAKAHYDAGVKASMQMYTIYDASLTVSDAAVNTYLTTFPYTPANGLEMIGNQYWINHCLNWWEAWSNWRRTGYPVLTPTNYPGNVTNGTIPQKLKYPNTEVAANPNFADGASAQDYTTKVWWAGGPE